VILADTSVWIEHLRSGVPALAALLEQGQVLHHPLVRGELACGSLRKSQVGVGVMLRLVSVRSVGRTSSVE
jgi:predicted nucleic acid-binding protein